jgi:hypothetical protein
MLALYGVADIPWRTLQAAQQALLDGHKQADNIGVAAH